MVDGEVTEPDRCVAAPRLCRSSHHITVVVRYIHNRYTHRHPPPPKKRLPTLRCICCETAEVFILFQNNHIFQYK